MMKEEAKTLFGELKKLIEEKRKFGKVPLFIVGAGVSSGKVPTMREIFQFLATMFEKKLGLREQKEMKTQMSRLNRHVNRLINDELYQSLPSAANFFGMLQKDECSALWEEFTADFVMGLGDHEPMWSLQPSRFHEYVAKEVVKSELPAFCISLNYDGLTAQAIRDAGAKAKIPEDRRRTSDFLFPCKILTNAEEIETHFIRNVYLYKNDMRHYPLIKLKGDIFTAVCTNEDCNLSNKPNRIPLYFLYEQSQLVDNSNQALKDTQNTLSLFPTGKYDIGIRGTQKGPQVIGMYKRIITCGCTKERKIGLDFPGYMAREKEIEKIIEMIYRYVLSSVSLIVACGISGKWDTELDEFLSFCINYQGIPIYCIDNAEQPKLKAELNLSFSTRNRFVHIKSLLEELLDE